MNSSAAKLEQAVVLFGVLCIAMMAGCEHHRPAARPAPIVSAQELASALRALPDTDKAVPLIQRPGFVAYSIRQGKTTVGRLSLSDLGPGPSPRKSMFQNTDLHLHGVPAVSTQMGDGEAVLVAGRFLVEADAFSPSVSDAQRDSWLGSVNFLRLTALATSA